ncbi:MAG: CBS domain-containing protein [Candidatus Kapaibacteriales bacterium]
MKKIPKVSEVMTNTFFYVRWNDPVHKLKELFVKEKLRHIPVVDNGKYVGMISETVYKDYTKNLIIDIEDEDEMPLKISDFEYLVNRKLPVLFSDDSILKPIELFVKKKGECFAVVDLQNNLVGILSYIDLLLYLNQILSKKD